MCNIPLVSFPVLIRQLSLLAVWITWIVPVSNGSGGGGLGMRLANHSLFPGQSNWLIRTYSMHTACNLSKAAGWSFKITKSLVLNWHLSHIGLMACCDHVQLLFLVAKAMESVRGCYFVGRSSYIADEDQLLLLQLTHKGFPILEVLGGALTSACFHNMHHQQWKTFKTCFSVMSQKINKWKRGKWKVSITGN